LAVEDKAGEVVVWEEVDKRVFGAGVVFVAFYRLVVDYKKEGQKRASQRRNGRTIVGVVARNGLSLVLCDGGGNGGGDNLIVGVGGFVGVEWVFEKNRGARLGDLEVSEGLVLVKKDRLVKEE
jgi:hypothetical protein